MDDYGSEQQASTDGYLGFRDGSDIRSIDTIRKMDSKEYHIQQIIEETRNCPR